MSTENPSQSHSNSVYPDQFVDRRTAETQRKSPGLERRQFSDSHDNLSPDAAELGRAVDQYKLLNRRRLITYEELLSVVKSLGYQKAEG